MHMTFMYVCGHIVGMLLYIYRCDYILVRVYMYVYRKMYHMDTFLNGCGIFKYTYTL